VSRVSSRLTKSSGCDGDGGGYLEVVVIDVAGYHVEVGYFGAAQVPQVVFHVVPVAGDIGVVIGEHAEHVVVGAIAIGGVIEPVASSDVMVRVEALSLVLDRQAELRQMPGAGSGWSRRQPHIRRL